MSKIGRKPIDITNVEVQVNGQEIRYKGKKSSGTYTLPEGLHVELLDGNKIRLICTQAASDERNQIWGLHRAILNNKIKGANTGFEQQLIITGLGFKGVVSGNKVDFSLGFSHKIPFSIPAGITIEVDKTGQILTVKGADKELVGQVSSDIKSLRPPEPYKGTGIKFAQEIILRKAGKTKASA